jgi:mannose-1-phosphate guanylyltransferase
VKGFVLAAGFGERLRPITESVPKPLLPVGNLPLVGYSLKLLASHGITDVIMNLHHLGKLMRDALGDGSEYGVQITYSEEEEILGTGGGLKRMHEQLGDETFVVVNSDTIIDVDLGQAIAAHQRRRALATMVLREDARQAEFGQIEVDAAGRIRRILGHGDSGEPLKAFMFAGVHVLEPRFLEYIPPDVNTCINRYAYVKALDNDESLNGFVTAGYFADAGTPERYYRVNADALDQRWKLPHADPLAGFALSPRREVAEVVRMGADVELAPAVNIVPPVLLGDGVRLADGASVGPYAILRAGVHVGREAVVRHAIVLDNVRIEAETEVAWQLVSRKGMLPLDSGRPREAGEGGG